MAYRSYFRSVLNDNFKILTWVLILFISITPNFIFIHAANAGAAEKWEYDVIPDQSQRLQIKGHKVDQYGAAVNDYDYNTKIDPKTSSNKFKMGTVGMGRLLKTTGWGLLGSAALEALLEAVDWVIDPESQSIWRNKVTTSNGFACKNFGYKWQATNTYTCPADAFNDHNICKTNSTAKDCQIKELWADQYYTVKVSDLPVTAIPPRIYIEVSFKYAGVADKNYIIVYKGDKNTAEQPKEYLTPETLADYANQTHPDYAKPDLAPKLAPHYNPSIQTDLWKPANPWEEINSPTVQEAKKQLENSLPEPKTDPEIKPNPETGGLALPSFCSWAAPVCDFIKWTKELPENDDNSKIDVENLDETLIFDDSQRFTFADSCPSPEQFTVSFFGTSQNLEFSYQPLCDFMSMIKPFVVAGSYLIGAYIVMGLSRGSGE